jgi:predicted DNA-binding transcriptional regulator AlpA
MEKQNTETEAKDAKKDRFNYIAREQVAAFARMPNDGQLVLGAVEVICGVSRPTLWRHIRDGKLPKPRNGRWRVGDIRTALAKSE